MKRTISLLIGCSSSSEKGVYLNKIAMYKNSVPSMPTRKGHCWQQRTLLDFRSQTILGSSWSHGPEHLATRQLHSSTLHFFVGLHGIRSKDLQYTPQLPGYSTTITQQTTLMQRKYIRILIKAQVRSDRECQRVEVFINLRSMQLQNSGKLSFPIYTTHMYT